VKKYRPIDGTSFKTYFRLGNEGYVCRAYPLAQANGDSSQPLLALHLQRDFSTSETVYQIAAEYDLTDREKEALLGIAMGLTSKEVAERMNISPNTVRAFVRLIMIKMGVTRRAAIISKLLPHGNDLQNGNQDLAEKRADRPPRPTNTYWKRGASSY
jgi:DNA-binding CsgD family transcriptional regulator